MFRLRAVTATARHFVARHRRRQLWVAAVLAAAGACSLEPALEPAVDDNLTDAPGHPGPGPEPAAGVTIDPSGGFTAENGDALALTVTLQAAPLAPVNVAVSSSNAGEATIDQPALTFTADDWDQAQQVAVLGVDDWLDDGDQPYSVSFDTTTSDDARYAALAIRDVQLVNRDDDTAPTVGELVIAEIMANPTGADTDGEWFEVANVAPAELQLYGLQVADSSGAAFTVARGLVVPPGGLIVFGRNADPAVNGGVAVDYTYAAFLLTNTADTLTLSMDAQLIDAFGYSTAQPAGVALSLGQQALDAGANDDAGNWCAAVDVYGSGDRGTPGASNPEC